MAGAAHHLFLRYCPSPMNLPYMVPSTYVSFGNQYACITHLQDDHSMSIVVYPQDIAYLYIIECKRTRRVHPGRQTAKSLIAQYESEGYAAHSTDSISAKSSSLPMVISLRIRIRLIVGPDRSLLILLPILQRSHGLIDFRRCRNRTITSDRAGYGHFLLLCLCH